MADETRRRWLTRRGLLAGSAAGLVAVGLDGTLAAPARAADDLAQLGGRWREIITGAARIDLGRDEFVSALALMDGNVDKHLEKLDGSSGRTRVFTDLELDQTTDSSPVTATYQRLRSMARAWRTPGSRHHADPSLLTQVLAGLDTAEQEAYRAGKPQFDNWWDWQIGTSKQLADCLVLLDTALPAAHRDRYVAALRWYVPDPLIQRTAHGTVSTSTGANRVDLCQAVLVEGIASRSTERIRQATRGLPTVCEWVPTPTGDGLYADGSFVQHTTASGAGEHGVAYTGAYGTTLLGGMAQLLALLAGTPYALTDPVVANLYDMVERGWAPVIHDGRMMSFVNGRTVSRSDTDEHKAGQAAVAAILRLGAAVDPARATGWRAMCKGWLERGARSPYAGADVPTTALFSDLLHDPTVAPAAEPDGSWVLRNMGRAVHRRAGWAVAISMASTRTARYESINGENLRGFHTGAGMTYLYDDDGTAYTDGFWPTADPYRLPGTTVDQVTMGDATGTGAAANRSAGGPVLDGRYAAVGMQMSAAASDLSGRKSWFCFDEYVVALGAGIRSGSGKAVETCLEHRKIPADRDRTVTVNGTVWADTGDGTASWADARWVHVAGVAGYVFPSARALTANRQQRQGSYRLIDSRGATTPITRRYLTLSHQHGANPNYATYAYLLVPKATVARTAQLASGSGVSYLSNNANCQAVRGPAGITMANVWSATAGTVGGITVDRPCGVIVQERDNALTVCVAEPEYTGAKIQVQVTPALSGYRLDSADSQVTVVSTGTTLVLTVQPGVFGRTMTARFVRVP